MGVALLVVSASVLLIVCLFSAMLLDQSNNPHNHTKAYRRARLMNWLPLGFVYAMLYFGRYNVEAANTADTRAMLHASKFGFGWVVTLAYLTSMFTLSFNGGVVDYLGGRIALVIGMSGVAVTNIVIGICMSFPVTTNILALSVLESINFIFQGLATCSTIKINSSWYDGLERGVFGGVFNCFIASGLFLAFVGGSLILDTLHFSYVFFCPGVGLLILALYVWFCTDEVPENEETSLLQEEETIAKTDVQEATPRASRSTQDVQLIKNRALEMLRNPSFCRILFCFVCNGFVRESLCTWFTSWCQFHAISSVHGPRMHILMGITLAFSSLIGGMVCGWVSDRFFAADRLPVLMVCHLAQCLCAFGFYFAQDPATQVMSVAGLTLSLFGLYSLIMNTVSMDFGCSSGATGTSSSLFKAGQYFGCALAGTLIGWLLDNCGPGFAVWKLAMAVASLLGLVMVTAEWLMRAQPGSKLKSEE